MTSYSYTKAAAQNVLKVVERRNAIATQKSSTPIKLRDYQQEAINAWATNNWHGFYVMATGTGKTWTAIYSAVELMKQRSVLTVICAPYKHLVRQWAEDVVKAMPDAILIMVSSENHNWEQQFNDAIVRQRIQPSGLSQYFFFDGESMIADLSTTGKESAKSLRKCEWFICTINGRG